MMTRTAAILVADGFEVIETLTPYDLLNRAGIETTLVRVGKGTAAPGAMGRHVCDLTPMEDCDFAAADANLVTGSLVDGAFDFALELIARIESPEKAAQISQATCCTLK